MSLGKLVTMAGIILQNDSYQKIEEKKTSTYWKKFKH